MTGQSEYISSAAAILLSFAVLLLLALFVLLLVNFVYKRSGRKENQKVKAPPKDSVYSRAAAFDPKDFAPMKTKLEVLRQIDQDKAVFCRRCGKNIPDDSLFCQYCGTEVLR